MYAKDVKRKCANVHERNILYIARMWDERNRNYFCDTQDNEYCTI